MNKVLLIGRLSKDPELKRTNTNISVCSFSIAVNRNYTSEDGTKPVDFINCVVWRTQAENLVKYMRKGYQIAVEGNLQVRTYQDNNGATRYVTEVVCDKIEFLTTKTEAQKSQQQYQQQPYQQQAPQKPKENVEDPFANLINNDYEISDNDLPFD